MGELIESTKPMWFLMRLVQDPSGVTPDYKTRKGSLVQHRALESGMTDRNHESSRGMHWTHTFAPSRYCVS
jgi:hypothetical protein